MTFPELPRNASGDERRFATYLGKRGYLKNFLDSGILNETEMDSHLHAREPTGPPRVLYLSSLQAPETPIGFILSNGEKLGEWIHWLPFIRFARRSGDESQPALRLFEIYQDRPWTKDGVLMATPPAYSIFTASPNEDDRMTLDVRRFADFENPSKIRSTLLVTRSGNPWATRVVKQRGYRAIEFSDG